MSECPLIYDQENWAHKWKSEPWAKVSPSESKWVLIPKTDPDSRKVSQEKHFRSKNLAEQADVYKHCEAQYREAKALEVMTGAVLNHLMNGEPMLDDYLRTNESKSRGGCITVGWHDVSGLKINVGGDFRARRYGWLGRALVRKAQAVDFSRG